MLDVLLYVRGSRRRGNDGDASVGVGMNTYLECRLRQFRVDLICEFEVGAVRVGKFGSIITTGQFAYRRGERDTPPGSLGTGSKPRDLLSTYLMQQFSVADLMDWLPPQLDPRGSSLLF